MLNKVYLNKANENWILDRLRSEWYLYNKSVSTKIIRNSEIIWICSPWTWKKNTKKYLKSKKLFVQFTTSMKKNLIRRFR